MKKEIIITGIAFLLAGLWYFTRTKTNYTPLPGQRGYGEGIGDGVVRSLDGNLFILTNDGNKNYI